MYTIFDGNMLIVYFIHSNVLHNSMITKNSCISFCCLGVFKYTENLLELAIAGLGFITIGWAFNALKGRI